MNRINNMKELTLFAPSNAAWTETKINHLVADKQKFREILNLHLLDKKLSIENIIENNVPQVC